MKELTKTILFNMFRVVAFAILYAIFEVKFPFWKYMSDLEYRAYYFSVFFVAMATQDIRTWFANFFASMTLEDVFYWVIKWEAPFQYAWYYPVLYHIPLVDIAGGTLAIFLYVAEINIERFRSIIHSIL